MEGYYVVHGAVAPGLVCGRITGDREAYGAPAAWHVIFDLETIDNSICCGEHLDALRRDEPPMWHPYDPVCSIAGAHLDLDRNRCFVPDVGVLARPASTPTDPENDR